MSKPSIQGFMDHFRLNVGGVESACKVPAIAQRLVIFATYWISSKKALPLQTYKISPPTPTEYIKERSRLDNLLTP